MHSGDNGDGYGTRVIRIRSLVTVASLAGCLGRCHLQCDDHISWGAGRP